MFIRFDMIHERDRWTDGQTDGQTDTQTPHDGYIRAYVWHRAAKICRFLTLAINFSVHYNK